MNISGDSSNHTISKKRQNTAERIIAALKETAGLQTAAAKKAGVTYWTLNKYVKDFPAVAQAAQEAKEAMLDFTEGKLFEQIKTGNMTAIIFYLKTQGKSRGYVERAEVTGAEGGPVKTEVIVASEHAKVLTEQVLKGKGTECDGRRTIKL